jgi:flagellar biosynthesis protein FlhF
MIVKSFEGISMKDAMKAVKREFGSDAVILSTEEKVLDTRVVEVRAAAPEEKRIGGASASGPAPQSTQIRELAEKIAIMDAKFSRFAEMAPSKTTLQNLEGAVQEMRYLLIESLKDKAGSLLHDLPQHLLSLERILRLAGISEKYATELVRFLQGIPEPTERELTSFESRDDYFKSHAMRWMIKRTRVLPRWENLQDTVAVQAFVGPTGSGKTTMIGKLATHFKRKEKADVLLISYDQVKLAATEQLKLYAKIIDCPWMSISKPAELEKAIASHASARLVLIDTAGCYPRLEDQIQDLVDLKGSSLPVEFHLVLSLTERAEHLDRAIRGFSPLALTSLAFTKIDESWSFGEIFNLSHKWSLPLSFFSNGQKVPDDLERATRERVVERIFGI